jgi:hypothetical protein
MIIPFDKTQKKPAGQPSSPPPSEAELLMALATMHKQGRFNPPTPTEPNA